MDCNAAPMDPLEFSLFPPIVQFRSGTVPRSANSRVTTATKGVPPSMAAPIGQSDYNAATDLNNDGIINIVDLVDVAIAFDQTC